MASFTTSSSSSLLPKTLLPVCHLNRFSTLSGIRVGDTWTPLLRSISAVGSRRRVAIVKAATVDSDYSSKQSSGNEQRETIMLPGCDYNHWLIVMEFHDYASWMLLFTHEFRRKHEKMENEIKEMKQRCCVLHEELSKPLNEQLSKPLNEEVSKPRGFAWLFNYMCCHQSAAEKIK